MKKKTRYINPFASPEKYKFKGMPTWFKKIWGGAMKVGSFFHLFLIISAILLAPIGLIVWFFTNFISAVNTDSSNVRKGCSKKTFYSAPFIIALALMTVGVYKVSTISLNDVKNSLVDNAKNKLFKEVTGKNVPVIPQRVKEYGEQGRDVADDIIDNIKDETNTVIWMGENLITKDGGSEEKSKDDAKSEEKKSEDQAQPKSENDEPDVVVKPNNTDNNDQETLQEEKKEEAVTEAPKTKLIEPVSTIFDPSSVGPEPLDPAIQQTIEDNMMASKTGGMTNPNPEKADNENVDVRRSISFE